MLRIIVYDIADAKRLRHVAKTCEFYGYRVEESVFECNLPDTEFEVFWDKLHRQIDPEEDFLIMYPVCRTCEEKIRTAGIVARPMKQDVFVF